MVTGVRSGWLPAAIYGPAARKGWIGVVGYIGQNNDLTQVCEGTGDFHGQVPILWTTSALLR